MKRINGINSNLLQIFTTFFKIGLFTFGGGYAMIPLIQKETVENKKWITNDDILEIAAVSESTPGPIAINSATFIGYKICGFWGAFFATTAVIIPSFVIIFAISSILRRIQNLKIVEYAFFGIRAGVLALVVKALIDVYLQCEKNAISYFIMIGAFAAAAVFEINVIVIVIVCAFIGFICSVNKYNAEKMR